MAQEAGSMSGEGGSNSSVGSTSGGNGTYTPPKGPSTTTPSGKGGGDPNYGKYKGKDGKYYNTAAEKTAADAAFDAAESAKATAADLASRTDSEGNVYATVAEMTAALTGKDGVKYKTKSEKQKADNVVDSREALGGIKPEEVTKKSDADILLSAQGTAGAAQAGAVSSATEAAKASGLSPAQAALLGSNAGSGTYAKTISGDVATQGQLAQEEFSTKQSAATAEYQTQMNTAMQKYAADVTALTGKTGQELQKYISDQGNALALQMQQNGLDAEKVKNQMNALGFVLQAGSWVLKALTGLAKGTENWKGGKAIVGEEGPEIVELPPGSRVIPADKTKEIRDIHDGYGMLESVINSVAPRLVKFPDFEASPEQPNVKLSDLKPKIASSMAYLKGAK